MDTLAVLNPMIQHAKNVGNLEGVNPHTQHTIAGNFYLTGFRDYNAARHCLFEAPSFLRNRYNLWVHWFLLANVKTATPITPFFRWRRISALHHRAGPKRFHQTRRRNSSRSWKYRAGYAGRSISLPRAGRRRSA